MSQQEIIIAFGDTILDVQRIDRSADATDIFKSVTGGHEDALGSLSYRVRERIEVQAPARRKHFDFEYARLFAISFLVHGFFAVAAFITPVENELYAASIRERTGTFDQKRLEPQNKKPEGLEKTKGIEGRFGDPKARLADAARSKSRAKTKADVRSMGLLGVLKNNSGAIGSVFNSGGFGGGLSEAIGGLRGSVFGDMGGAGGMGSRGTGPGGGGNAIGIGGLAMRGKGSIDGADGGGELGPHRGVVVPREVACIGEGCNGLPKADIAKVIRRNIPRFRHCYEKELNANPNLAGKVAVTFTIGPTGSVIATAVRETSIDDAKVEGCVLRTMQSLKFPQPKGGGVVIVTYPFVFQSNG